MSGSPRKTPPDSPFKTQADAILCIFDFVTKPYADVPELRRLLKELLREDKEMTHLKRNQFAIEVQRQVEVLRRRESAEHGAKSRKGRDCPRIFEMIRQRLRGQSAPTSRKLWDQIVSEIKESCEGFFVGGVEVYFDEDGGRMHEDGGKSLSLRSFERYVTGARKLSDE